MKTFIRRDNLRLAAITLYTANFVMMILGIALNINRAVSGDDGEGIGHLEFGAETLCVLACLSLIVALKFRKIFALGIGYTVFCIGKVLPFVNTDTLFELVDFDTVWLKAGIAIIGVCLLVTWLILIFQIKTGERITDNGRKLRLLPGCLYLIGYLLCVAGPIAGLAGFLAQELEAGDAVAATGITRIMAGMLLVGITLIVLINLLETVALFCTMKWLTCPAEAGEGNEGNVVKNVNKSMAADNAEGNGGEMMAADDTEGNGGEMMAAGDAGENGSEMMAAGDADAVDSNAAEGEVKI